MIIIVFSGVFLVFGLVDGLLSPAHAASLTLPPRPGYNPDSGEGEENGDNGGDAPIGAYIELQVQPARKGLWTVVQWQDSTGGWRDVEGWQGSLEAGGYKRWWVAAKDFDTGPFRWVVYQRPGSQFLAAGVPFNLPHRANEMKRFEVSLGP